MRKKDQWRVYDIYSHKSMHYNIKPKKSFWHTSSHLGGLAKGGLTVLISVLMIYGVVQAGSLTPLASPVATSYTLSDIYTRLTANSAATAGNHNLSTTASVTGTFYTLTQIYNAIPTISATKVLIGTNYLGIAGTAYGDTDATKVLGTASVAGTWNASNLTDAVVKLDTAYATSSTGTLVPSGGTLTASNACNGLTFFGVNQTNWNLQTGTLNPTASTIMSGTTICGVAGASVANPTYGDNDASKVLTTAGNIGTYNATNLTPANVRNTITFGPNLSQTGTFTGNLAYGDDNAANVLTIAATPGTYNVTNLSNSVIKQGTTWGVSLGSTGILTPDGGTAGVADLFNGKTANLTADWTLDAGILNLACNTATFDGVGNRVADAYDGTGTGLNRWCITDSGNAAAGDILSGKIGWVNGIAVTGTISTQTLSAASETVTAGYYNATTLSAVDADLAVGNIKSGVGIFGKTGTLFGDTDASKVCSNASAAGTLSVTGAYLSVGNTWCGTAGTLLANLFNGSLTAGGFTGGSQTNGGVDDYNAGNAAGRPTDSYSKGWTACTSGADNYCGTADAFADMKDNSTGLVWSKPCSGSGCSTSAEPADTIYSWDNSAANNSSSTASVLCSQNLGTTHGAGWSLPHQKQLMQAYIDGSYGNLEAAGVNRLYWSGTTLSWGTTYAWYTTLSHGSTYGTLKTNAPYVRCVRQP